MSDISTILQSMDSRLKRLEQALIAEPRFEIMPPLVARLKGDFERKDVHIPAGTEIEIEGVAMLEHLMFSFVWGGYRWELYPWEVDFIGTREQIDFAPTDRDVAGSRAEVKQ